VSTDQESVRRPRHVRAVAAVAGLALVIALGATLMRSAPRHAYDNEELPIQPIVLNPSEQACQLFEFVPEDADRVRVWVSTAGKPGGPLEVTASREGRVVARGSTSGGYRDSPTDMRLRGDPVETENSKVCVRNASRIRIAIMGSPTVQEAESDERVAKKLFGVQNLPGVAVNERAYSPLLRMRLEWRRPGEESWLEFAPTLAERAALVKPSFVGSWTLWAALIAVLASGLGALVLFVREAGR
jgi:hypothetical protein